MVDLKFSKIDPPILSRVQNVFQAVQFTTKSRFATRSWSEGGLKETKS